MSIIAENHGPVAQLIAYRVVLLGLVTSRMVAVIYEQIDRSVHLFQEFQGIAVQYTSALGVTAGQEIAGVRIYIHPVIETLMPFLEVALQCGGQYARSEPLVNSGLDNNRRLDSSGYRIPADSAAVLAVAVRQRSQLIAAGNIANVGLKTFVALDFFQVAFYAARTAASYLGDE